MRIKTRGEAGFATHVREMAEKAKAGDISSGPGETRLRDRGTGKVEHGHELGGFLGERFRGETFFNGGRDDARSEWLGEHEVIAGMRSVVGDSAMRMQRSRHREAVKRLGVLHGVTTGKGGSGFGHFVRTAAEDGIHIVERDLVGRHCDDVHRGDRLAPHRVNIRERIGSRDLAEEVGVVDNRGKKIERLHERDFLVDFINRGIIRARGTNEEIRIGKGLEATQDLREFGLAELRGSSAAGGEFRQTLAFFL